MQNEGKTWGLSLLEPFSITETQSENGKESPTSQKVGMFWCCTNMRKSLSSKLWFNTPGSALGLSIMRKLLTLSLLHTSPTIFIRRPPFWCLLPRDSQVLLMPFSSTFTVFQVCLLSGKVYYKNVCWFSTRQYQATLRSCAKYTGQVPSVETK